MSVSGSRPRILEEAGRWCVVNGLEVARHVGRFLHPVTRVGAVEGCAIGSLRLRFEYMKTERLSVVYVTRRALQISRQEMQRLS